MQRENDWQDFPPSRIDQNEISTSQRELGSYGVCTGVLSRIYRGRTHV